MNHSHHQDKHSCCGQGSKDQDHCPVEKPTGSEQGEASHDHHHGHHQHADHDHQQCQHQPQAPSNGDSATLTDPVCGMTVAPDAEHRAKHDGQEYRFCSAHCRHKFVADPQRYLKPSEEQPAAVPGTQYTCPMHPEIVRDEPGSCPLCGMALEPMMPSLEEAENPELTDFRRRFWWTLPLSLVVLVIAMAGHRLPGLSATFRTWLELALAAPVVLWAGFPFFARWAESIANRSPNMWTLIGTGVGTAFGYSLVGAPTCGP